MAYIALTTAETDTQSPLDDGLFLKIKDNFDYLNTELGASGNSPVFWEIVGKIRPLTSVKRSIGMGLVTKAFTPAICRYLLKKSGTSGTLDFDLRKAQRVNVPITGIDYQYTAATQSMVQQGTSVVTQSIARSTAQISTQSITFAKTALNVQSIINVGGNYWQYNLDAALDSDNLIGDSITMASCTTGANNATFVIVDIGRSGGNNFVVTNASGVAQTGVAGTAQPEIMSYNFTNPVSSEFVAAESVVMASHTTGANNGTFTIFKINQAGNNIWVKIPTGVVQAGVLGNANVSRWVYTYLAAVSTTDFIVSEKAKMAAHTTGANNGSFTIVAINSGGNNIVVHNALGVAQAGVLGGALPNRWKYTLPSNPTSQVTAGDTMYLAGHTTSANNGTFTIKETTASTVVVYNESGVAQAGVAGNVYTTKKLVKFVSDQSAIFTTDSYIDMWGVVSGLYNLATNRAPFKVLQVNRGGGANYNVVIDNPLAPSQASPAGHVATEMKSIFSSSPSVATSVLSLVGNQMIAGTSSSLTATVIAANTPILLFITSMQVGDPQDLTIVLN